MGAAGAEALVILAPEARLPWVDGIEYLGRTNDVPELYLPTHRRPNVAPAIVLRALRKMGAPGPVALVDEPPARIDLTPALRLDPGRLSKWLEDKA